MGIELSQVVPWGRTFDEYREMFLLTPKDLDGRILDIGAGPCAFNAHMYELGRCVVSVDPLYVFSSRQIQFRVGQVANDILRQLQRNMECYDWSHFKTPENLVEARLGAMRMFCRDFEEGVKQERYIADELPELSMLEGRKFDLAVCSHLLFCYSGVMDLTTHINSVVRLCQLADQVRIFPLLNVDSTPSQHVECVVDELEKRGFGVSFEKTDYRFQKGADRFLKIQSRKG